MVQWLSRWIHNPVFPSSNPGGGKVDSAFHPSEVSEAVLLMLRKCVGIRADRQRPPLVNSFGKSSSAHSRGWHVPQSRAIIHNANDSLRRCNVKLCVSVKFQPYVKYKIYIALLDCFHTRYGNMEIIFSSNEEYFIYTTS